MGHITKSKLPKSAHSSSLEAANFYIIDATMTKALLFHIMGDLEETGPAIVEIVFDMDNTKLFSELQLSPETTSFHHPTDPSREHFAPLMLLIC